MDIRFIKSARFFALAATFSASIITISPSALSQQSLFTPQQEAKFARGRRELENIKLMYNGNTMTMLQYYEAYRDIENRYFEPTLPIQELNDYMVLIASYLQSRKITVQEFEYLKNRKIRETAKELTGGG